MRSPTLWVVTELYYPELTSTGRFLTGIAEGLGAHFSVRVLCAQPTYSARGTVAPWREQRNGVRILRCPSTLLDKNRPVFRLVNMLTLSISAFLAAVILMRRGDMILAVTNPPTLPALMLVAARLRGAKLVVLVHDVFPEALVVTGTLPREGPAFRLLRSASSFVFRRAAVIVALGRDMSHLIRQRHAELETRMQVIPNWGDTDRIVPRSRDTVGMLDTLGLRERFVVQYLGNMGRTHAVERLLDCAALLSDRDDIHFLLCGEGVRYDAVAHRIARDNMTNVTLLPPCPEDQLPEMLAACDLSIIPFVPGMSGVSVPSRIYNVLAAGRPILAVADEDSEVALIVREAEVGWVLPATTTPASIAAAIIDALEDPLRRAAMGERARQLAEANYTRERVVQDFTRLFDDVAATALTPLSRARLG